ncbi:MAG: heat-inducible transcriptional repressor HrcA [Elusimicrobiota bacterium]|jgi:heat-inducible transcriptional repressor|nr:heat-inducible transcriptional repressor HrcA [Elusimicrobiota bacterium]
MRQVAVSVIKERKDKILHAVINQYIKTAKPVGSDVIISVYNIDLSPATVRNLMAELEEEGFLTHPHTSAGRIPTDKGYRTYVDSIMKLQEIAIEEEERIKKEYSQKSQEIESVLLQTSKILSNLSQYTGFVMAPKMKLDIIKSIELLQIAPDEILIILLTNTMIKHKRASIILQEEQIRRLRKFLNDNLRGIPLSDASERIIREIRDFKRSEDEILSAADKICDIFYDIHDDIYIGSASNAMEISDENDFEAVKSLIRFNEDKNRLFEIIDKDFGVGGINIKIGSESSLEELKNLSIVTTAYNNGGQPIGILGIIGPKRMKYDKIVSLVSVISKALNEFLQNK